MLRRMPRVLVLNGPNLGRLGSREPDVYGSTSYDDLAAACRALAAELGLDVEVRQTDDEAELIGWLHEAVDAGAHVGAEPGRLHALLLRDPGRLRDGDRRRAHAGRGPPDQPAGPGGASGTRASSEACRPGPSPASASSPTGWPCGRSPHAPRRTGAAPRILPARRAPGSMARNPARTTDGLRVPAGRRGHAQGSDDVASTNDLKNGLVLEPGRAAVVRRGVPARQARQGPGLRAHQAQERAVRQGGRQDVQRRHQGRHGHRRQARHAVPLQGRRGLHVHGLLDVRPDPGRRR